MVQSLVQKKTQNVCIDWVTIHAKARRSIYIYEKNSKLANSFSSLFDDPQRSSIGKECKQQQKQQTPNLLTPKPI